MAAKHKRPDCTGIWVWEIAQDMGITFVYCNVCWAPGAHQRDKCQEENAINEIMKKLAKEGAEQRMGMKKLKNRLKGLCD